jgi:hypothetical protein
MLDIINFILIFILFSILAYIYIDSIKLSNRISDLLYYINRQNIPHDSSKSDVIINPSKQLFDLINNQS